MTACILNRSILKRVSFLNEDIIEIIDRPPHRPPELVARGANRPPLPPKPQVCL